ncbi:MAG: TIGR04282 family arsenosugar biosynthesis glycosyltransferase [Agarilytica sp.]
MNDVIVAQFLKSPEHDAVKTRLYPVLSETEARALHKNLASHVTENLRTAIGITPEIWSSCGGPFAQSLSESIQSAHHIQCLGDLGQRLTYAMRACLSRSKAVIFIGSDCPFINAQYITSAVEQLVHHDAVIGPANDGGYVLLGMRRVLPQLFTGVTWGSEHVFSQTLQCMRSQGMSYHVLTCLPDIDRPEDLSLLQRPGYEQLLIFSQ